jgi:hypothetical protein
MTDNLKGEEMKELSLRRAQPTPSRCARCDDLSLPKTLVLLRISGQHDHIHERLCRRCARSVPVAPSGVSPGPPEPDVVE